MRTVELTGRLGRLYGKSFQFAIETVPEAVQALCANFPGFEDELRKGQYRVVKVSEARKQDMPQEHIGLRLGSVHTIRIIPVAAGAKSKWWQVILGAVLVGAAFLLTGGTLSATAFTLLGTSVTGSQLALVGGLLALSGVAAALTPEVAQPPEPEKEKPSYMINSPNNLAGQGHPIFWNFGREFFMSSVVISNSIYVEDFD